MRLCCPHKKATGRYQGQFNDCEQFALITYKFLNGERETEPSPKSRIYPSVRNKLKQSILAGKTPKRAVHKVTEKKGGIFNASSASEIPKTNQAYRISKITRKASDNPLKQLIEKQHRDGRTGDSIIQKIQTTNFSYDVALFNDRIVENIPNFCCTNDADSKSALCFDFTFDLGKNPPYYVLVTSFQNIYLIMS